jgi:DNA-binding GntR family transcriptional regulator
MDQVLRVDPLYEQIYQRLEQDIIAGDILPGERLIDTKIASDLGVSRSPVREAFRKLERDGLLINKDGIVTVFTPSLQDALELYQVRIGLESVAVYWATQIITKEQLELLEHDLILTKQAVEHKNIEDIITLNTKFHESLISFSENQRLKSMMNNIRILIRICRNTTIKQYNRSDSFLDEHYSIFQAICMKEPELAAKRMEQHLYNEMLYFKDAYLKEQKCEPLTK